MAQLGALLLVAAAVFIWASKGSWWRTRRRLWRGHSRRAYRDERTILRGRDRTCEILAYVCLGLVGVVDLWLLQTDGLLVTQLVRTAVPESARPFCVVGYVAQSGLLYGWRTMLFVVAGVIAGHLFW